MKISRLFTIIIIAALTLTHPLFVSADEYVDDLRVLGIVPNNFAGSYLNENITRAEFAYMSAKFMKSGTMEKTKTRFADVTQEHEYSGYIEYLAQANIMSGIDEANFNPTEYVNINMANKVLVHILGYDGAANAKGGYPTGYTSMASSLGITKGVNANTDGYITKAAAVRMVHNALRAEVISATNITSDTINMSDSSDTTPLSDWYGVSVYAGSFTVTGKDSKVITFTVTKNQYKTNPVMLSSSEQIVLEATVGVDTSNYENVPVIVWVNKNNQLIHVKPQSNVQVLYGSVYAVNGKTDESVSYSVSYINTINLIDDENDYTVSDTAQLKYNNVNTNSPVRLSGRLAKIVLQNDEIIFIESWDFQEGGIINSITSDEISYMKGEQAIVKLRDIYQYKRVRVFIDGESALYDDLKPDSLFYYYADENYLTICASEKNIVDILKGVSDTALEIGYSMYNIKDVYYATDGVTYKQNTEGTLLIGAMIKAYIAPDGNILYIKRDTGFPNTKTEFYGIVSGVKKGSALEDQNAQIELFVVGSSVTKKLFYITKRTKYETVAGLDELDRNSKALNGSGVYQFTANGKNEITEVKKAEQLSGFEGHHPCPVIFIDGIASMVINGKMLYFPDVLVTALYEENGAFAVKQVPWSSLQGRYCGAGSTMTFYGKDKPSAPSLVILEGNTGTLGNKIKVYGVITKKTTALSENGNIMCNLTVVGGGKTKQYQVTQEYADSYNLYSFIGFYDGMLFSDNEIAVIDAPVDFSGAPDNWQVSTAILGLKKGVVEKINDKMVYLTNGEAYSFHPNQNFFVKVSNTNPNARFTNSDVSEVEKGDTVFLNVIGDGVRGVIFCKE